MDLVAAKVSAASGEAILDKILEEARSLPKDNPLIGAALSQILDFSGLARRNLVMSVNPAVDEFTGVAMVRLEFGDVARLDRGSLSYLLNRGAARLAEQEDAVLMEWVRRLAVRREVQSITREEIAAAVAYGATDKIAIGLYHLLTVLSMHGHGFTLAPSGLLRTGIYFGDFTEGSVPAILPSSPIKTLPKGLVSFPRPEYVGRMEIDGDPKVTTSADGMAWHVRQGFRIEIAKPFDALWVTERLSSFDYL